MTKKEALKELNKLPQRIGKFIDFEYDAPDDRLIIVYLDKDKEYEYIKFCDVSEYPENCGALILNNFGTEFTTHISSESFQKYEEKAAGIVFNYLFSKGSCLPNLVYYASDIKGPYNNAMRKTMRKILHRKNINSGNVVHHYIQTKS